MAFLVKMHVTIDGETYRGQQRVDAPSITESFNAAEKEGLLRDVLPASLESEGAAALDRATAFGFSVAKVP